MTIDRVLYVCEAAEKIADLVAQNPSALSVNDRIGLALDTLAFAKAGLSEVSSTLAFLERFREDPDGAFRSREFERRKG